MPIDLIRTLRTDASWLTTAVWCAEGSRLSFGGTGNDNAPIVGAAVWSDPEAVLSEGVGPKLVLANIPATPEWVTGLGWNPSGATERIFAAAEKAIWELQPNEIREEERAKKLTSSPIEPLCLCLFLKRREVLVGCSDGVIRVFDFQTTPSGPSVLKHKADIKVEVKGYRTKITSLAISPSGEFLAVTYQGSDLAGAHDSRHGLYEIGRVRVFQFPGVLEKAGGSKALYEEAHHGASCVTWHPRNPRYVASAGSDGCVRVHNLHSKKVGNTFRNGIGQEHVPAIGALSWVCGGSVLIFRDVVGTTHVWSGEGDICPTVEAFHGEDCVASQRGVPGNENKAAALGVRHLDAHRSLIADDFLDKANARQLRLFVMDVNGMGYSEKNCVVLGHSPAALSANSHDAFRSFVEQAGGKIDPADPKIGLIHNRLDKIRTRYQLKTTDVPMERNESFTEARVDFPAGQPVVAILNTTRLQVKTPEAEIRLWRSRLLKDERLWGDPAFEAYLYLPAHPPLSADLSARVYAAAAEVGFRAVLTPVS